MWNAFSIMLDRGVVRASISSSQTLKTTSLVLGGVLMTTVSSTRSVFNGDCKLNGNKRRQCKG
eukprot:m.83432 g.83432  ORF g.83432 m.83432 type:complete len:63 (+) comp12121_c2_seq4:402-590(+)